MRRAAGLGGGIGDHTLGEVFNLVAAYGEFSAPVGVNNVTVLHCYVHSHRGRAPNHPPTGEAVSPP